MTATLDERRRIFDAYERRDADPDRYDARRADQVALRAARARIWGRALRGRDPIGTVLEIGCGTGAVARWIREIGATQVFGIDLQLARLAVARDRNPSIAYAAADGRSIPVAGGAVHIVLCSTLFSSVLDEDVAVAIAREVDRVLARDGVLLWFDFFRNNPSNPDVRGVTRADIARWFPDLVGGLERVVLAPPIARRCESMPRVASVLECLPMLRTHLAGAFVRR